MAKGCLSEDFTPLSYNEDELCLDCNSNDNKELQTEFKSKHITYEHIKDLNKPSFDQVSIYPNPASDVINIISSKQVSKVSIYNINGILVGEYQSISKINIDSYAKGNYLVEVVDIDNKRNTAKFTKR